MKFTKKEVNMSIFILIAFVLGMSISSYIKNYDKNIKFMTSTEMREIEDMINAIESEIVNLNTQKIEYTRVLEDYSENYDNINISINDELNKLEAISGIKEVEGEGIRISVYDSDREIKPGENPNDFLVHDIDILKLVNDLKMVGSKAIAINGERVLSNTSIRCSGSTITINDKIHNQPFIIDAIGDISDLKTSMISPNSYAELLKNTYGIQIDIEEYNKLVIKSKK